MLAGGVYELDSIYLYNQGYVNFTSKIKFANEIKLFNLSRTQSGLGGNFFELRGNGFSNQDSILVYGKTTTMKDVFIISRSPQHISFLTPQFGRNLEINQVNIITPSKVIHGCKTCVFTTLTSLTPLILNFTTYNIVNRGNLEIGVIGRNFDIARIAAVELHTCRYNQKENEK